MFQPSKDVDDPEEMLTKLNTLSLTSHYDATSERFVLTEPSKNKGKVSATEVQAQHRRQEREPGEQTILKKGPRSLLVAAELFGNFQKREKSRSSSLEVSSGVKRKREMEDWEEDVTVQSEEEGSDEDDVMIAVEHRERRIAHIRKRRMQYFSSQMMQAMLVRVHSEALDCMHGVEK